MGHKKTWGALPHQAPHSPQAAGEPRLGAPGEWQEADCRPQAHAAQRTTHHFAEVTRQVGPLRVVEDAIVPAPDATALGDHAQQAELTGHLK